jgi:hypothetical protein
VGWPALDGGRVLCSPAGGCHLAARPNRIHVPPTPVGGRRPPLPDLRNCGVPTLLPALLAKVSNLRSRRTCLRARRTPQVSGAVRYLHPTDLRSARPVQGSTPTLTARLLGVGRDDSGRISLYVERPSVRWIQRKEGREQTDDYIRRGQNHVEPSPERPHAGSGEVAHLTQQCRRTKVSAVPGGRAQKYLRCICSSFGRLERRPPHRCRGYLSVVLAP